MAKSDYNGNYYYSYCTKSSHFSFVLDEVLKNDVFIETSSAFDLDIVEKLHEEGKYNKDKYIICNGFKRPQYIENVLKLNELGFQNIVPICDNIYEVDKLKNGLKKNQKIKLGIRIASEEEPKFEFYTSRLGVRYVRNHIHITNAKS